MNNHKKVVIASHYVTYGAADALSDYLNKEKIKELVLIKLPFHIQRTFSITYFSHGKQKEIKEKKRKSYGIFDYFLDFYSVFATVIKKSGRCDIFIGVNNLNAFCGLLLRKVGKVEKVLFYGIDFVPQRFENKILNSMYHAIEAYCIKHCDYIWNVSPRMAQGREKYLKISKIAYKQEVVPIGVWSSKKEIISHRNSLKLLFIGTLLEKQGVQIVLEAIPAIIYKIPDFKFVVVGWGDYEKALKRKVKQMNIENYVTFVGAVRDRKKLEKIMEKSACAIAPYMPSKTATYHFTYYADPTKIKDYLSVGLPVILTDIPYNAKEIEKNKCGIVVSYTKESIAEAVIMLLQDTNKLMEYRKNAFLYISKYNWNAIFAKALQKI